MQTEIELYLAGHGFDLAECFSVDGNCIRYLFHSESSTVLVELYEFTDENGTTPFVWVQLCAGTVRVEDGNNALRSASDAVYQCAWPFRACLIEDQGESLLTLDFRANATAFEPWYLPSLIEAGCQLAEYLRRECNLELLKTHAEAA